LIASHHQTADQAQKTPALLIKGWLNLYYISYVKPIRRENDKTIKN